MLKKAVIGLTLAVSLTALGQSSSIFEKMGAKVVEEKDLGDIKQVVVELKNGRKEVGYITKDGKYVIIGQVFDTKTGTNITREKYKEINKIDVSKVPLDEAVKITFGKGGKKLIMVADPDCPFCRRGYHYLKNKDVEVYLFLFPLNIHPQAYDKSVKILCSKDPAKAYDDVENGKPLKVEKCKAGENKLKKHILIANKLGVNGTPMFITMDGQVIAGLNKRALDEYLSKK